ncbi:fumarate hydratase C-terminal domain-containing protein [bacterium]|nr:fumarate hydratase C-terminal domain-containing protein [bacterium]
MKDTRIEVPLSDVDIEKLRSGDRVLISGVVYTLRDSANKRLLQFYKEGKDFPFPTKNSVIYYAAPTPPKPGHPLGSLGPTTASRMDVYVPFLLEKGIRGMIGKGKRSEKVKKLIREYRAIYFLAVGGAGAFLSQFVREAKPIAFLDLGPEAIFEIHLEDFPALVAIDSYGESIWEKEKR